jgi:hypothetical protein
MSKRLDRIKKISKKNPYKAAMRVSRGSNRFRAISPAGYQKQQARKQAKQVAKKQIAKAGRRSQPQRQQQRAPQRQQQRTPQRPSNTVTPDIPAYQPQYDTPAQTPTQTQQPAFDTSGLENQITGLNQTIGDLTAGFQNQIGTLQAKMEEERAAAAARLQEMQGSFQQALAAKNERQQVEGIRFADRGTGGATQQQLQRKGLRGTFGRAGDRLMKISSLNV